MSEPTQTFIRNFAHSVRFRLLLWFTSILAIVLVFFSSFLYITQSRDLEDDSVGRLERQMLRARDELNIESEKETDQNSVPFLSLEDAQWMALLDASGNVITSKGELPATDLINFANTDKSLPSDHDGDIHATYSIDRNTNAIIMIEPIGEKDHANTLIMASALDPDNRMKDLRNSLLIGSLLTLLISSVGGYWLASRAMKPVGDLTRAARAISESDLSVRVIADSKDEIGELADTFNQMLARLQTAFERQRQFVSDASHELRTPLTIINLESRAGFSDKSTLEDTRAALRSIHDENQLMSGLVNDLLTLARMDAGQMKVEKKPNDLSDIALDAIDRLRGLAEGSDARLEAGDLPETMVNVDRAMVLQMTSDLIENAIKHGRGKKNVIKVCTGLENNSAFIQVSDSGHGIPKDQLPFIFDRFYRVDQVRSRNEDEGTAGSGLGLSIVRFLAEANGGVIEVDSSEGVGTTFVVKFPLAA